MGFRAGSLLKTGSSGNQSTTHRIHHKGNPFFEDIDSLISYFILYQIMVKTASCCVAENGAAAVATYWYQVHCPRVHQVGKKHATRKVRNGTAVQHRTSKIWASSFLSPSFVSNDDLNSLHFTSDLKTSLPGKRKRAFRVSG